jgi:hypothetical protein
MTKQGGKEPNGLKEHPTIKADPPVAPLAWRLSFDLAGLQGRPCLPNKHTEPVPSGVIFLLSVSILTLTSPVIRVNSSILGRTLQRPRFAQLICSNSYCATDPFIDLVDWRWRMVPAGARICESGWMRKGIEVRLGPDRERLDAVVGK